MIKILLITDAWHPQVNGVVFSLQNVIDNLPEGYEVQVVHPGLPIARQFPIKVYHDVKLVSNPLKCVLHELIKYKPDFIHIATEGPLGIASAKLLSSLDVPFTTSYHSSYDIFMKKKFGIPKKITNTYLLQTHKHSKKVLVPTKTIKTIIEKQGFKNVVVWSRGVDCNIFHHDATQRTNFEKTIIMVARASQEKNIDDFCKIKGYKKIFVGDGPYLKKLKKKYKDVEFTGYVKNNEIYKWLSKADVFVFPSKFDTYGIVMLEANACGLPVAAYPVQGPIDVIVEGINGKLDTDLNKAIKYCFDNKDKMKVESMCLAQNFSWQECSQQFIDHICD